jgi:hypothetical protein
MQRDGALAEVAFHWSQLTPPPSKPIVLHSLDVAVDNVLQLSDANLLDLGVESSLQLTTNYERTQAIGAATAFLGYNGMIVPSVRWNCENLILFANDHDLARSVEVVAAESVEWQTWAHRNGFLI